MRPLQITISFVLLSVLLLIWAHILRSSWTKPSKLRSVLMKGSVSVSTVICLFLLLEIVFYSSFAIPDGTGFSLASRRWSEKYWHPINSLGYRDVEHKPTDFHDKKVIFIVGDSFAAGFGIPQIENRFSNILQRDLGEQYLVVNVAQNNWSTADEYRAILSYPYPPKKIVLSYFINDIRPLALKAGYIRPGLLELPRNRVLRFVINRSYFLNSIYWRLYMFQNKAKIENFWERLKQCYSDPNVWAAHEAELGQIVTYTRNQGIDLSVVVFPNLTGVKESAPITSKVTEFFEKNNVRVLNLQPLLEGRDPTTMIVNSLDSHPNESLNREVAGLLTRMMQAAP